MSRLRVSPSPSPTPSPKSTLPSSDLPIADLLASLSANLGAKDRSEIASNFAQYMLVHHNTDNPDQVFPPLQVQREILRAEIYRYENAQLHSTVHALRRRVLALQRQQTAKAKEEAQVQAERERSRQRASILSVGVKRDPIAEAWVERLLGTMREMQGEMDRSLADKGGSRDVDGEPGPAVEDDDPTLLEAGKTLQKRPM